MEDEIDFSFMRSVGQKVNEIIVNDANKEDWISNVTQYYDENNDYPSNLISEVLQYLVDLKEYDDIVDDIKKIIFESSNVDNLLGYIFFPEIGEEEEEEFPPSIDPIIATEDEPVAINEATLDPEAYFDNFIKKEAELLYVSNDIAYAILNKFFWNKNLIDEKWFNDRNEILKSLRIEEGSEMVPNLKCPLSMKKVDAGECPFCYEETELYQLYCGHKICKDCLIDEILQQVNENRPPVCRQQFDDERCNAEIMTNDVHTLLNDEQFNKYSKIKLNDEVSRDNDVYWCKCPHCNWIITPANRIPCFVGRCYRCNSVTCLKGDHDSHAPLIKCEYMENFTIEVKEEMEQLEKDQKAWFAREERLKDYRRSHTTEVRNVFDKNIADLKKKQQKEEEEERKRIKDIGKEINELQDQISQLRRNLNSALDSNKPKDEINRLTYQIEDLSGIYNQKVELQKLFIKDKNMNDKERNDNLNTAQQEESFFLSALSGQYQFFINKFKESQDIRAYQNISITSNDDDYIKRITKKCPKCHSPIQRTEGCNYMGCHICGLEFCWLCEQPWRPTHSDHFTCPKLKEDGVNVKKSGCGIDFNDMNDFKFYPQPMSIEKRANFIRYNNLYGKFREQKEKYDKLFEELMSNGDNIDLNADLNNISDHKLCMRKKLEKHLRNSFSAEDSEINALRICNTILFAQSVVMWSYPSLYYMVRDPQKAQVFEFKIASLAKSRDRMLDLANTPSETSGPELMRLCEALKREIDNVIDDADIF